MQANHSEGHGGGNPGVDDETKTWHSWPHALQASCPAVKSVAHAVESGFWVMHHNDDAWRSWTKPCERRSHPLRLAVRKLSPVAARSLLVLIHTIIRRISIILSVFLHLI